MKAVLFIAGFSDVAELENWLSLKVEAATIIPARGLWQGAWENSAQVILYGIGASTHLEVEALAASACQRFDQAAVLVEIGGEAYTINRKGARLTIGKV